MNRLPLDYGATGELVPRFREVLELCNVRPGEIVLLHKDTVSNPHYAAAALGAALELDAVPYEITVPSMRPAVEEHETIVRAWQEADLVLDLVSTGAHLFSILNTRALEAGTRVLRVAEPVDVLNRMFPSPEVRAVTREYAELLSGASVLRVTSALGTDLTMDLEGRAGVAQYGLADEPGRWDHWPSGLALIAPVEGSVEGVLRPALGDLVFLLGRFFAGPATCEVAGGRVVGIEGGVDAALLEEWLDAQHDERASVVSVVGVGTDHRARWDRVAWHLHEPAGVMDSESYAGNVRIGLGNNASSMLRGANRCPSHIDLQLRGCTVLLGGVPIVEDGRLLAAQPQISTRGYA